MKRTVLFSLICIISFSCSHGDERLWLFKTGESMLQVENLLIENSMDYEIKDGMIISPFSVSFDQRQVFEYAGTDWNGFLLYFEDGKLNSFYMQYTPIIRSGEKLQPFDSERVTTYLDNILGAHETYLKECKGYTAYIIAWRLNSVIVMLSYDEGFRGTLLQMVPKMDICAPEGYNRIF